MVVAVEILWLATPGLEI